MGALMGLLACMRPIMDCQSTLLNETLATVLNRATVWPLVGMDAVVSLKIRLPVEALHCMLSKLIHLIMAGESIPCHNLSNDIGVDGT